MVENRESEPYVPLVSFRDNEEVMRVEFDHKLQAKPEDLRGGFMGGATTFFVKPGVEIYAGLNYIDPPILQGVMDGIMNLLDEPGYSEHQRELLCMGVIQLNNLINPQIDFENQEQI